MSHRLMSFVCFSLCWLVGTVWAADAAPAKPVAAAAAKPAAARQAYFGDLHVHTRYSFDAFLFGTRTDPNDAYRFAKGEAIPHPGGYDIQIKQPLDFYAVTDHDAYLGLWSAMTDPKHPLHNDPQARRFFSDPNNPFGLADGMQFLRDHPDPQATRNAWQEIIAAADRHNQPGKFTTLIAYEYTASRERGNLHRNVFFRDRPADLPFSMLTSPNPEDLWRWLDQQRAVGIEALAIPHNSNGSDGRMFEMTQFDGTAINGDYANLRTRNEPLVEITQIKGTSDTHPALSPNDEWADFEIMPYRIASRLYSQPNGSYLRQAWLRGLELQQTVNANPYQFGVVGASDTHDSGDVLDESRFVSKVGSRDDEAVERGSVPAASPDGIPAYRESTARFFSSSGLTGVWADENTRAGVYDALRRKETFATTGPRIRVRLFAGYGLTAQDKIDNAAIATASARGVAMGGALAAESSGSPKFLVWAMRDANAGALQRVQVIKGWYKDNRQQERVYDVACADGLTVDKTTHRCPDNGATVNLADCSVTANKGAAELATYWSDPDFDPNVRAIYYIRALENPSCRWSTWDAVRAGTRPRADLPATIQERAWTSPIWVNPRRG